MPGIGASLREARMRERIDITEAEADTKIRGKYLRALENEEWGLLPGPTFVKSFLRTYADYLGLDGRTLVEEFKLKYERPEMQAIAPPRPREQGRGRRRAASGQGPRRLWIALALLAVVLVGLFVLGRGDGDGSSDTGAVSSAPVRVEPDADGAGQALGRLSIVPRGQVYACLRNAAGRRLLDGVILQPGQATPTYRSSRLRLALDGGRARIVVNGRERPVPAARGAVGYLVTADGAQRLASSDLPTCR
jgi:hypothetical protein